MSTNDSIIERQIRAHQNATDKIAALEYPETEKLLALERCIAYARRVAAQVGKEGGFHER